MSGAVRDTPDYRTAMGRNYLLFYYTERSEQVNCANTFRMDSM